MIQTAENRLYGHAYADASTSASMIQTAENRLYGHAYADASTSASMIQTAENLPISPAALENHLQEMKRISQLPAILPFGKDCMI